eukprot:9938694-Ditylum_brightwellii.AAC.1
MTNAAISQAHHHQKKETPFPIARLGYDICHDSNIHNHHNNCNNPNHATICKTSEKGEEGERE